MKKYLLLALLTAVPVHAQQASSFSVQATAISLTNSAQTAPAADVGFRVQLTDRLALRSDNILSGSASGGEALNAFFGGIDYAGFPFDRLASLLRLDAAHFQLYATGSLGVDRATQPDGSVSQHIAALAGGGLRYDPTGSGKFAVTLGELRYGWMPGMFGTKTNNVLLFATGIKVSF